MFFVLFLNTAATIELLHILTGWCESCGGSSANACNLLVRFLDKCNFAGLNATFPKAHSAVGSQEKVKWYFFYNVQEKLKI